MSMDYGDEYLDEMTAEYVERVRAASTGPRHARPKVKRHVPALVRRMAFWTLVFGIVWAIGAAYLAIRPPVFDMNPSHDAPPSPTAHISSGANRK